MKPYAKLRGRMQETDNNGEAVANFLGRTPGYVSMRLTCKIPWDIDEAYCVLDFLDVPSELIFEYFPPFGGIPQKRKGRITA